MNQEQLQNEFKPLYDGLLMRSETENPFEFYYFENTQNLPLNTDTVAKLTGKSNGAEIKTEPLDHFFRGMVTGDAEAEGGQIQDAERFRRLQQHLEERLQNVLVFKAEELGTTAYILGQLPNGDIAGLRTVIVEP